MLIGMTIGGFLAVFALSLLVEWAIVKRIAEGARARVVVSVILATALAIVIYGFGNANGGPWRPWPGGVAYIIGGMIVFIIRILIVKDPEPGSDELTNTFE